MSPAIACFSPGVKGAEATFSRRELAHLVGRQVTQSCEIDRGRDQHRNASRCETVVPADRLAKRTGGQRREKRADVDAEIIDRIGAHPPLVAFRIECTDLRRDVRLERADPGNQAGEREEQRGLEYHQKVAGGHQQRARDRRDALTEKAIRHVAADDRRRVGDTGEQQDELRREGFRRSRAVESFQRRPDGPVADDRLDAAGKQGVLHQIERQKRTHAGVGKALPHFGGEEHRKPLRMAEQV